VNIIDFDIDRDFRDLSFKKPLDGLDNLVNEVNEGGKKVVSKVFSSVENDQQLEVTISQYSTGDEAKGVIMSIVQLVK